ncbi:hypothetical protein [Pseudomonas sp. GM55]|uniref:hypothetical protein n=1 Tax=Pseudomonas sp. GM55 TaxID=1144333 RepID=UPI0002DF8B9D|nr:hypothetical protein [Pseudomonas sp. GM55]
MQIYLALILIDQQYMGAETVTANASTGLLWALTAYLGRWHEYRPVRPADSVDGHGRTFFGAQHTNID